MTVPAKPGQVPLSSFALLASIPLALDAAIQDGRIKRGDGDSIRAVLWYCDLRGFTAFSDRNPPQEVVSTLDSYFDAMSGPIQAHDGEILKFIGDGLLAMFEAFELQLEPRVTGEIESDAFGPCISIRMAMDSNAARMRSLAFSSPLRMSIAPIPFF